MDHNLFKKTMSNFASGICVITTIDISGNKHAITISSFASLSLEPAMVLFCIGNNSYKYQAFIAADHVSISILNDTQSDVSEICAKKNSQSLWHNLEWFESEHLKYPAITGALAVIECSINDRYAGGDHTILTANVLNCNTSTEHKPKPLIHFRSGYCHLKI